MGEKRKFRLITVNNNKMADYSKQWCDENDPGMTWDFDMVEEYSKLKPGFMVAYICEGYGTVGIAKGHNDEFLLALPNKFDATYDWVPYEQIVKL
jgi:hypothetical protein